MTPRLFSFIRARFGLSVAHQVAADLRAHAAVRPGTPEHAAAMAAARDELAVWDAAHAATPSTRLAAGVHVFRSDGSRRGKPARRRAGPVAPAAPAMARAA